MNEDKQIGDEQIGDGENGDGKFGDEKMDESIDIVIACVKGYEIYLYFCMYMLIHLAEKPNRLNFIIGIDLNNSNSSQSIKCVHLNNLTDKKEIFFIKTGQPRSSLSHGIMMNQLTRKPKSKYVVLIDTDVILLQKNWDTILINKMESENIDVIISEMEHVNNFVIFKNDKITPLNINYMPPQPLCSYRNDEMISNTKLFNTLPNFVDAKFGEIYFYGDEKFLLDTCYQFPYHLFVNKNKIKFDTMQPDKTAIFIRGDKPVHSKCRKFMGDLFLTHHYGSSKKSPDLKWMKSILQWNAKKWELDLTVLNNNLTKFK